MVIVIVFFRFCHAFLLPGQLLLGERDELRHLENLPAYEGILQHGKDDILTSIRTL
jgi:hypothetical protein